MKFMVTEKGEFETDSGMCLGDYIELVFYDSVKFDAGKTVTGNFSVRIMHSLVHNDEFQEDAQMVIHTWKALQSYLDAFSSKKLNCLSVNKDSIVNINHTELKNEVN